ncbi:hypothetical protein ACE6H2_003890 [Prunus campanulata]
MVFCIPSRLTSLGTSSILFFLGIDILLLNLAYRYNTRARASNSFTSSPPPRHLDFVRDVVDLVVLIAGLFLQGFVDPEHCGCLSGEEDLELQDFAQAGGAKEKEQVGGAKGKEAEKEPLLATDQHRDVASSSTVGEA